MGGMLIVQSFRQGLLWIDLLKTRLSKPEKIRSEASCFQIVNWTSAKIKKKKMWI